jgi:predicted O-methyltransferase YrrM
VKRKTTVSYSRILRVLKFAYSGSLNIFEYGPGTSTKLMAEEFPEAKITTIEHDRKWFNKYDKEFCSFSNLDLRFVPFRRAAGKSGGYVTYPLEMILKEGSDKFDIIFIDGRERRSCLIVAKYALAKKGIVVIHDSERKGYRDVFGLYNYGIDSPWYTSLLSDDVDIEYLLDGAFSWSVALGDFV